jgi:hypothetical protein
MPLDPGREWLAAGITGLQRQREWDAVATSEGGAGEEGDEVEFVALADGSFVVETGADGVDTAPLAQALGGDVETPYRALAVRRSDVWVVGAVSIEVATLDPDPRGNELELVLNGGQLELTIDELPADPAQAAALERIATGRIDGPFAAHAHRLRGDAWELSILAL